mgnify:CR=1 FL=1
MVKIVFELADGTGINFQVQLGARLVEGKKCPEKLTFSK